MEGVPGEEGTPHTVARGYTMDTGGHRDTVSGTVLRGKWGSRGRGAGDGLGGHGTGQEGREW